MLFPGHFPLFCALVFTSVPHDVEARRGVLLNPIDAHDEASETEELAKSQSFGQCWVLWLDKHLGPTAAEPDAETLLQINRDCSAANHQDVLTALFGLDEDWDCGDCDAKCLTDVCAHVRGIVAVDDDEVPVVGGSATGGIAVDDDEDLLIHGEQQQLVMDVRQDQAEHARMLTEFMEMVFIDYRLVPSACMSSLTTACMSSLYVELEHGLYVKGLDMQFTKQGSPAGLQKMQDSYAWKDFSWKDFPLYKLSAMLSPLEWIESDVMVPAEWIEPKNPFDDDTVVPDTFVAKNQLDEFGAENPFDEFGAEEGTPADMSDETDEDLVALVGDVSEEKLNEVIVALVDGMSEEDLKELLEQNPFDAFGAENAFDEFGAEVSPEPPVEYKPLPETSTLA